MALTIGTQLGSHEITALLGKGGMGEVYRARDLKLKREVAIKILPDEFSRDADRVNRFQREAEVLASLNHPNIAAIYDLQEAKSTRFLVLELVEGETLAERIARGPIPVEETLDIAKSICEALEAAHEKGIVHRDLKPANVKVAPDAKVKVLDFGLAKALETIPSNPSLSNSPTLSLAATNAGVILGTAAYMSPEQAKGTEADLRSDVFSFGCVLYEMLTGRQAFHGESVSEILAAVLIREVDLSGLPPDLNSRIPDLLRRCLQKNPKRRWQAVGDLRAELETTATAPRIGSSFTPMAVAPAPVWKRSIPAVLSAIVFGVLAGAAAWTLKPAATPAQVLRFSVPITDSSLQSTRPLMALSADDTKLVYASASGQLFLRHLSEMEARPLPGAIGLVPFFSPDGEWVGFFAIQERALKKIAITGGAAITLCKADALVYGASWTEDGILFGDTKGVMRVSADGGEPELLVPVETDGIASSPQFINEGRTVLFTYTPRTAADRTDQSQIMAQRIPKGERKVILRGASDAHYLSSGHLIFSSGENILAVPFDPTRLELKGGTVSVIERVRRTPRLNQFSVSARGSIVYMPGNAGTDAGRSVLALADRNGNIQKLSLPPAPYDHPRVSPADGKTIAFSSNDANETAVFIYDLSGVRSPRRLTFGGNNSLPLWSRAGRYIYFRSDRHGQVGLFRQLADGTGTAERLSDAGATDDRHFPLATDASGKALLFEVRVGPGNSDIWMLPLDGDRKPKPFLVEPNFQSHPVFSPDGRWLAYMSNQLVAYSPQIFVQPYPMMNAKYQITTNNGGEPLWSPDGKQVFYYWDGRFNVVDVQTGPAFSFGKSAPLPITGAIQNIGSPRNYDMTPDGKFIIVLNAEQDQNTQSSTPQLNVVLNWFRELQERVPVK